jgi:hypothetical protein
MKQLLTLVMLIPFMLKGQTEYRHFCSFDAESTAKHILMKHVKHYLHDTVEFSVEKRGYKYAKKYLNADQAEKKVLKALKKGNPSYSNKTNSGYTFTIVVVSKADETEIVNFIRFEVDHFFQKIISIEISKGQ